MEPLCMIKVLIVDDSAITRSLLTQILEKSSKFEIVGFAFNGKDAISLTKIHHPDVIIMDVKMPIMNGLEATKIIMNECPTAILIFTTEDVARIGYSAIEAGAIDILPKPDMEQMDARFFNLFLQKIESASKANIKNKILQQKTNLRNNNQKFDVICIGASTGGPVAVQKVLQSISTKVTAPILITQHIDKSFDYSYAHWLNDSCNFNVQLACDGIVPLPGNVYIAPAEKHLIVAHGAGGKSILRLVDDEPVHFLKPAVDKLFFSAAQIFRSNCLGVVLTGMGKDGAEGCVSILENGGYTIAQSESSCVIYGMPKAAIEINGISKILNLDEIGSFINSFFDV